MKGLLKKWNVADEKGQGMVEYGLIIGLIAVIVVAIFIALGPQIKSLFQGAVSSGHIEKMESAME